ncbi:hypothetical protein Hanom_Chr03g00264551 [Helianthus anomalus]
MMCGKIYIFVPCPDANGGKMSNMEMTSQLGRVVRQGPKGNYRYFSRLDRAYYLYIIK